MIKDTDVGLKLDDNWGFTKEASGWNTDFEGL